MSKNGRMKSHGKMRKILIGVLTVLVIAVATIAVLLSRSCQWMLKTWTGLTMEELVYHLNTSLEGTNSDMIWDFIQSCVIITGIVCILLVFACVFLRKRKKVYGSFLSVIMVLSIVMATVSVSNVWTTLDVSAYANNQSEYSTFIDDNYVNPKDVTLTFPQQKRNLIYIFLESMENTYSDTASGGAFDTNVIPELTELSLENENFSGDHQTLNGGYAMPGATWTVGAMFAQSTGLPLNIPIEQNSMNTQDSFFPEIVSIGDILESAGYNQTLLIGSEAEFGGRKLFYEEHGNFNIIDYNYAAENGMIPEGYKVWWGYEDKRLFEFAKDALTELAEQDEPFNLTMLTVDTHFEDGYRCEDCPDLYGDNVYADVMACSSQKVYEFVQWIQEQPFYENTTIVISGDHLTMDSDFCEDVPDDYTRKVYTTYINAAAQNEREEYRTYTTFDNFPTTLASLGVTIEGNRLGLGTNLFSGVETLSELYGYETESQEISKKSALMEEFTAGITEQQELQIEEETMDGGESEEELQAQITADITADEYNYNTGKFTVYISNIQSNREIQSILCAVWPDGDQSKLIWYETNPAGDGSYQCSVFASDFGYQSGIYDIHVYARDTDGNAYLINGINQFI